MGIKTLSLFFIDKVDKYREYDNDGNELLGEYGKIFEQEYNSVLSQFATLEDTPYQRYLKKIVTTDTHKGYFSIDKKTGKIILLDFKTKIRNLGDTKKSGFSYYHSSKFGRPDSDKHNFQLSMYEKLHNILGFSIDERGIIPIEYDANEDGTITKVYLTENTKGTTLESKGYYTMPHRTYIDNDIDTYVFNSNPD
jgi:hypothetical protein